MCGGCDCWRCVPRGSELMAAPAAAAGCTWRATAELRLTIRSCAAGYQQKVWEVVSCPPGFRFRQGLQICTRCVLPRAVAAARPASAELACSLQRAGTVGSASGVPLLLLPHCWLGHVDRSCCSHCRPAPAAGSTEYPWCPRAGLTQLPPESPTSFCMSGPALTTRAPTAGTLWR